MLYDNDPVYVQNMLDKVFAWCNDNLLTINCKKSQWMRVRLIEKRPNAISFHLGNSILKQVTEYKYLGLIMDIDLSFQSQRGKIFKNE